MTSILTKLTAGNTTDRFKVRQTRSGAPVVEAEGLTAAEALVFLGAFTAACFHQRGEAPSLETPKEFQPYYVRLDYTGLFGEDADRPWHVLNIDIM